MQASIYPGRSLIFSPSWDEEGVSVVFDKGSGDYWIITDHARAILDRLSCNPSQTGVPTSTLAAFLATTSADLSAAIDSLAEHRLIRLIDDGQSN